MPDDIIENVSQRIEEKFEISLQKLSRQVDISLNTFQSGVKNLYPYKIITV